jgi:hypothetical protein
MTVAHAEPLGHAGSLYGGEVAFRIGVHTIRFRSPDPAVRFFVHEAHEPFLVDASAAVDCEVNWVVDEVRPSDAPVVREAGARWELRRLPNGIEEFAFRSTEANVPTLLLRMSADMCSASVVQAPRPGTDGIVFASEYPWSEFIICRLLGRDGGLLVHASSVVFDEGAILFVGHSGAGKSTIAAIAEECGGVVLSDDRTIVTVEDNQALAWGTPWHGTFARGASASVPVRAWYMLVQADGDSIERVPMSRGLKELFVRLIQPRITGTEVGRTMDALTAALRVCPLRILRFRPTSAAVALARAEAVFGS